MERKALLVVCGIVTLALFGCGRDRGAEPATTTTTGAVAHDDAMTRLANARCDRAQSCNNIGQGKKHADRDACMREATQNARSTLRSDECPRIDPQKMNSCINDIKNQGCENPLDTLDTITSCTRGQLCMER